MYSWTILKSTWQNIERIGESDAEAGGPQTTSTVTDGERVTGATLGARVPEIEEGEWSRGHCRRRCPHVPGSSCHARSRNSCNECWGAVAAMDIDGAVVAMVDGASVPGGTLGQEMMAAVVDAGIALAGSNVEIKDTTEGKP